MSQYSYFPIEIPDRVRRLTDTHDRYSTDSRIIHWLHNPFASYLPQHMRKHTAIFIHWIPHGDWPPVCGWFLSVRDKRGGFNNTHESTYNTNGSARQSRLPSHLQRWSSCSGIDTDWQDHTEICAVTAYPLWTQNIRSRFTSHKIFIHLHHR